jgi:hypothetical protein
MPENYCGNNSRDAGLINGTKTLGTRYSCLRKGIGLGKNQPYDPAYNMDYDPIDTRKIYCGKQNNLPAGYDSMGNLHQCLTKGIGVGKKIKAEEYFIRNAEEDEEGDVFYDANMSPRMKNKIFTNRKCVVFALLSVIVFVILYFTKPSFVLENDDEDTKKRIDWKKFSLYYVLALIVLLILICFV